jgi:hypothetical protein
MHKILHYPGYSLLQPPDDEFSRFLQLHGITDEEIEKAKLAEKIPDDSVVAPKQMVVVIRSHYGIGPDDPVHRTASRTKSTTVPSPRETLTTLLDMGERIAKAREKLKPKRYSDRESE